ncbi:hypothetical protein BC938DRAFT_477078 [Jimgerdemannia flammicorona]|uniref:Uncharacterized protein n=1 Tax=Jimgerdemannia flammicorona TaxID=994334 RepID=A0A433PC66_9FUNG|nr:hypothetical protein BC938DRAFT_477078 [Jimgerdemannia flammicorona]
MTRPVMLSKHSSKTSLEML